MCSGITCGSMLNGEVYAQRFQKLIYLHLLTDCFMKISLQSPEQIQYLLYLFQVNFQKVNTLRANMVECIQIIYIFMVHKPRREDRYTPLHSSPVSWTTYTVVLTHVHLMSWLNPSC